MHLSRRRFVQLSTATLTVMHFGHLGKAENGYAPSLHYPATRLAALNDLKVGEPLLVKYPDPDSLVYLLKLGQVAHGGVGPQKDVVAFSGTCTHLGCPVDFVHGRFLCPCHYSMFDPAKNGQVYQGVASAYLPQIPLQVRGEAVYALAVDGLLWGRARNLVKG